MARHLKLARRPYSPPSFEMLDGSAAKAELKAMGEPKDPTTQKILSLIDEPLKKKKAKFHP